MGFTIFKVYSFQADIFYVTLTETLSNRTRPRMTSPVRKSRQRVKVLLGEEGWRKEGRTPKVLKYNSL